jgi:hypothetical protein
MYLAQFASATPHPFTLGKEIDFSRVFQIKHHAAAVRFCFEKFFEFNDLCHFHWPLKAITVTYP